MVGFLFRIAFLLVLKSMLPTHRFLRGYEEERSNCCKWLRGRFLCFVPLLVVGVSVLLCARPSFSPFSFLTTCILTPIGEELLFRGYLTNLAVSRLGVFHGIASISLLFSVSHILGLFTDDVRSVLLRVSLVRFRHL